MATLRGATGTPISNQQVEAASGSASASQNINQQALQASSASGQRVVSEAAVSSVRATRSSSSPDKVRDPEKARELAKRVAEDIVTEGRDSAHRLDPMRAQPHIA